MSTRNKIYKKYCVECNAKFETRASNKIRCDACRDKRRVIICALCGKEYAKPSVYSRAKYCTKCAKEARHIRKDKKVVTKNAPAKSIDEIVKIARANHISYGEAVTRYGF